MRKKNALISTNATRGLSRKTVDGREMRSQKTKQKIQATAEILFAQNGFNNVTVDNIVAAAKISKGTFYLHFSRKEDLLLEYAERRLRHAASILPEVLLKPTIDEAIGEHRERHGHHDTQHDEPDQADRAPRGPRRRVAHRRRGRGGPRPTTAGDYDEHHRPQKHQKHEGEQHGEGSQKAE